MGSNQLTNIMRPTTRLAQEAGASCACHCLLYLLQQQKPVLWNLVARKRCSLIFAVRLETQHGLLTVPRKH